MPLKMKTQVGWERNYSEVEKAHFKKVQIDATMSICFRAQEAFLKALKTEKDIVKASWDLSLVEHSASAVCLCSPLEIFSTEYASKKREIKVYLDSNPGILERAKADVAKSDPDFGKKSLEHFRAISALEAKRWQDTRVQFGITDMEPPAPARVLIWQNFAKLTDLNFFCSI